MTVVADGSVLERFAATVAEEPARPLFSFVGDRGEPEGTLTAAQAWARAAGVSMYLRRTVGVRPGDRVALVYPPSLDFVVGLFGCMLAGAIPVPLAPPDPMNPRADLARFSALVASCTPRAVLTNTSYQRARLLAGARDTVAGLLGRARPTWPELPWHTTDGLSGDDVVAAPRAASDVALLQYTSGSTSTPRGVRITYGNLAHQLACNAEELGVDGDARAVFWVPHFHDFGLVSGILSAAFSRAHITMMSPLTFLKRPELWIDLLSRVRGTHTAAPNFAWDLVVRKTTQAQRAAWDLSALRVAMSAAEPVRDDVVRRFCEAFAPSGFRPEAFCPAYGLAEHTVGVSVGGRGRLVVERGALERGELRRSREIGPQRHVLVGCGRPSRDVVVRVVDPETRRALPAGAIGELWVDSPSKADGYWGDEEASRATFEARLADPEDTRGYLRTGDLGALVDGEVYVTGRLKEMLIVGGRNLYPQDLEDAVRDAHPDIRPGGVAAFAVDPGDGSPERLVLLLEARRPPSRPAAEEIALAARRRLLSDHQVRCETVVVGAPRMVLKTSSGKVRRLACRAAFLAGELGADAIAVQAEWPAEPASATTEPPAAEPPEDPRVTSLAPSFEALIVNAARYLSAAPADRGEKTPRGIAARGWLEVRPAPGLPAHRFFAAGRRFRVILRHDNRTTADDAAPDARVASLRLLRDDAADLDAAALDLPMLTGRCFFHRTAEDFFRFSVGSTEVREALLRAEPHRGRAAWEGVRLGERYGQFHYHSQTVGRFVAADGAAWFVRYRLRAPEVIEDSGFVDPQGALFPPTAAPRRAGETRPETCLRDAFAATIRAGGARYVLEAQLAPVATDPAVNEARLDCTRPWPEEAHPWRALASLHLDALVDDTDQLAFNPANAPADLGVVHARHERQSASIDHVRTIVYEVAAGARSGRPLSPGVAALLKRGARLRTVAVVGAGASGLSVARSLEAKGFTVTVFERAPAIGGMCATLSLDGRPCDVGGHMIFPDAYPNIVALAKQFDLPLVPDFPECTVSLATGEALPRDPGPAVRAAKARASGLVLRSGALQPGTAAVDPALAVPASEWIEREGLEALWGWMGPVFTGAGYGYAEDRIPAAYLVKALRHTGDQERRWQLAGGFQALWERVAASLRDVRPGHEVRSVTRDERGVRLVTRRAGADGGSVEETHRFDQLVIAHSPAAAGAYLDGTDEERDLFGRVRHLRYVSAWLTVEGLPAHLRERWCFLPEHTEDARTRGHALAFVHTGGDTNLVAVIAYAPVGGLSQAESLFAADFARLGARLVRTRWIHEWAYFPHFSADDLRAGCLARLEALQGARHTWHASTLLSFELTECAVAYAVALAGRIAGGTSAQLPNSLLGTGAPAPVTPPGIPVAAPASFADFRAIVAAEVARMERWLQTVIVEELDADTAVPPPDLDLANLGIDSLRAVRIHQRISDELELTLEPTLLSDVRDIRTLARHLVAEALPRRSTEAS